ncbi:hypothetical protein BMG_2775 [Priestia megaterium]|jgi:hypothetical protein|nr:hypothetical protein BMG_2775 [Priestia megaterium]
MEACISICKNSKAGITVILERASLNRFARPMNYASFHASRSGINLKNESK